MKTEQQIEEMVQKTKDEKAKLIIELDKTMARLKEELITSSNIEYVSSKCARLTKEINLVNEQLNVLEWVLR